MRLRLLDYVTFSNFLMMQSGHARNIISVFGQGDARCLFVEGHMLSLALRGSLPFTSKAISLCHPAKSGLSRQLMITTS